MFFEEFLRKRKSCDLWVMTLSAFLIKLCLIVIRKDMLQFFVVYLEVMLLSFFSLKNVCILFFWVPIIP